MDANKIRIIRIIRENPRFRHYPEYKESGVEWIGEIPVHSEVKRLKYVADLNMGQSPPSEEYNSDQIGTPFLQGNAEFGMHHPTPKIYCPTAKKHASPGDILVSVRAPVGALNIADQEYGIGRGLCAIRPRMNQLERHYAKYLLEVVRTELHVVATGSTYDAVTVDEVSNLTCVVPSFSEQIQIANFLDRKTEQIDELIRLKERRIELLRAQRTALINQAVTKGLDPNVEMKPSGVEWIGKIPRHWTLTRLKYVSSIPVTYGLNIEADRYTTEGIRLIRITDIDESGGLRQKGVYLSEDCVPQEQMLNSYDLLLSRSGATVGKSYLHLEKGKYTSAGYLVRFNFDDYWTSKFIYYVTLSHFYRNWLEQQIIISTIQNVNGEKYSNFQLPIPLYQEHKQIVDFLDRKTEQIDELIAAELRKIELLKEYRQSLISEAVTGKIDVRNEV